MSPRAHSRLKQRLRWALAFFGRSAQAHRQRAALSCDRRSRWVQPCRQGSPATRLSNSVASCCRVDLNAGPERLLSSYICQRIVRQLGPPTPPPTRAASGSPLFSLGSTALCKACAGLCWAGESFEYCLDGLAAAGRLAWEPV